MLAKYALIASVLALTIALPAQGAEDKYNVRLIVSVVSTPPYPDEIYIAGSMNDWQPGELAIPHVGDGVYVRSFDWPVDGPISYKFTRDKTWATVEKGTFGDEISDRVVTLSATPKDVVIYNHVARWSDQIKSKPTQTQFSYPASLEAQRPSTRSGNIQAFGPVPAPQLGGQRQVLVYLPPGYDASDDRYPVIYMLDGQNVFDESTAYIGIEWGVDEALEKGIADKSQKPCIVVAIYNSGNRVAEYTPYAHPRRGGGEADKFLAFLIETVKPLVDKTYRTKPEREHTTLVGASLGGLTSLYAAMTHSDVFQSFGVVAPSLQWTSYKIMDTIKTAKLPSDLRLWIEVGEGRDPLITATEAETGDQPKVGKYTTACRELVEILKSKGISDAHLHYAEHESEFHDEREWGERATDLLSFLVQ